MGLRGTQLTGSIIYTLVRGCAPIVVVGITIRMTITITISRRIWPIIVATNIVPIHTVAEIIISNEVHINMLFLSNQRG
jgi:hypothetical protein